MYLWASKAGWQIHQACMLSLVQESELRQILELYLILRKECHDQLARSAMRAREEGLDLSL